MADPILFYFDFASPYAYFASTKVESIAAKFGRTVEWRPILLWAILKAHAIPAPLDPPIKRAYLVRDMERSAAFLRVPYRHPVKLPISTHLAARLFFTVHVDDPEKARTLAACIFASFFTQGRDISDRETIVDAAREAGLPRSMAEGGMEGERGRSLLEGAVAEAVEAGMVGSPYFMVGREGFFGVDRLPQLSWYLAGADR